MQNIVILAILQKNDSRMLCYGFRTDAGILTAGLSQLIVIVRVYHKRRHYHRHRDYKHWPNA